MNPRRYMVRGKRTDNGKWVEGYLTQGFMSTDWLISNIDLDFCTRIKLDTVEPLAEKMYVIYHPYSKEFLCPNCKKSLDWMRRLHVDSDYKVDYCVYCGQRLLWE